MWVPEDAAEIERAATGGDLEETSSFDAKADLPQPRKNSTLAVDVAAMATDGGVLLYGVAEDANKRPTIPKPIALAGAAERIDQIVSTSISEVPYIDIREYPCANDASRGYALVLVPQSERAPHQVIVNGDMRFYGRGAKGNRKLNEGDIARLYERRQRWTVDQQQLLEEAIAASGYPELDHLGYVHAFAQPVPPDQSMWENAESAAGGPNELRQRIMNSMQRTKIHGGGYSPALATAGYWSRRGADERRLATVTDADTADEKNMAYLAELRMNIDGRGHLFVGRAADIGISSGPESYIIESVVAGNLESFLAGMSAIYAAAGYHGQVDIGVAVTGIQKAYSVLHRNHLYGAQQPYPAPTFTRTARVAAGELAEPSKIAHRLLRHFYEATSGIDGWSPFSDADS